MNRKSTQLLILPLLLLLLHGSTALGQTPSFSYVSGSSNNSFPLNTNTSNRVQWIFPASYFPTAPSGNIVAIYLKAGSTAANATFSNFTIRMGTTAQPAFTAVVPWLTGTNIVYSAATQVFPAVTANGWVQINLQTPFFYTGSGYFIVDISQTGYTNGFTLVQQSTTPGARMWGLVTATGGTSFGTGLVNFGFDVTPAGPCTAPPTAGTTTVSDSILCQGSSLNLNLSGNSWGGGQTFQWQTAATVTGPWTNLSTAQVIPFFSTTVSSSLYYRCAVTCGTTTSYSTPQLVTVPSLFPGGSYTINNTLPTSGSNYNSFSDAVNAIKCGIAGPVVFDVAPGNGPYNEQVLLPEILNTSSQNTITFNGNYDTLSYGQNAVGSNYGIFTLDGTDYVRINKLVVSSGTGTYGFGVLITKNADHNIIDSCVILLSKTATNTTLAGIAVSESKVSAVSQDSDCDSNTISNNTIVGGFYGITAYGGITANILGTRILNNKITDFYSYGIYTFYCNDILIDGNDISRPTRTNSTTFYGIRAQANLGLKMRKNRVHEPFTSFASSTSSIFGLYLVGSNATAAEPNEISNNQVYKMNGNSLQYLLYINTSSYCNVYYNTIVSDDTTATTASATYGFYQTLGTNNTNRFMNNLIYITRTGTGIKYGAHISTVPLAASDRNDFYIKSPTGTNYTGFYNTGQTSLAAWQTATSMDVNSKDLNPYFDAAFVDTLYPTNDTLDNMCLPIPGMTTDLVNTERSVTTPDVGAVEFAHKCNGPANAGVVQTSDTGMCPGYTFILTDTTYQKGVSWLARVWEASTGNANTWYPVAGSENKDTLHIVFPNCTMSYRLRVICLMSGDTTYSNSVTVILKPVYKCYCYSIAEGGASDSSDIGAFSINSFATNTGGPHIINPTAIRGRTDYTDMGPIVLYKDSTYNVNIYHTLHSQAHANAFVTLFMDFNNNNTYDYTTDEAIYLSTGGTWVTTDPNGWFLTNQITIPHAVITNVPTGMRLILNNDMNTANTASTTACGEYTSGETEDYVVIFKEKFPTTVNAIPGMQAFSVYPNPGNGLLTVSFTAQEQLADVSLTVIDITGRIVASDYYRATAAGRLLKHIDLSHQSKGVYMIALKANNGRIIEKIIVQ